MNLNTEVVITGGSSGLGAAFAEHYAQLGFSIVLIGRRVQQLNEVANRLTKKFPDSSIEVIIADLAVSELVTELCCDLTKLSNLKVLVNNAGYNVDGRFHEVPIAEYRSLCRLHMHTTVELTHAALPTLIGNKGTVINVSSISAFMPTPLSPLYGPTKLFIKAFTDSIAANYSTDGIRAITLCPGFIKTDFHSKLGVDTKLFYKRRGLLKAYLPNQVVDTAVSDLKRGRTLSIHGWNYKLIYWVSKLMPQKLLHRTGQRAKNSRPR
jgi:short-subunit dehydrogenase